MREGALSAYENQDAPFEKLVEQLQPERDPSRNPLFQVTFQLRNFTQTPVPMAGLKTEPVELNAGIAKFDLALKMTEDSQGLMADLDYNTDLFDAATIERMVGHFQNLLEGIVVDPERRVSELPILAERERQQLLVEWIGTKTDYPQDRCIHELFEAQEEKTPDTIAVVFEDERLTYRELNSKANQLAHHLKKLSVGPDMLVGIFMERSLEMIVGLLGVLKAGAAYLPLHPTAPQERVAFMLEDSSTSLLLTQKRLIEEGGWKIENTDAPSGSLKGRTKVLCLDADWEAISQEPLTNPNCEISTEKLAYVIYTSGSTGKPKGVLIEHLQILNYVKGIQDRCGLEPGASYAMLQPLSVDSSQTVIFPALTSGGSLHIISEVKAADPDALGEYFHRFPVDLLKIAPSHLAALQASPQFDQILPRRWLIIGGEASRRDWLENLQAMAPQCAFFNHYGPTEATVGVLTYRLPTDRGGHGSALVPLGRPLANTQVYVLDRHLQPVPVGVAGELHIGGHCLARGYLNHPELSAEKFIADPFGNEPGARLYKTGDLGRYLPDGNIEFLGRSDDQVKIRGFRVEPGESEAALAAHPGVRQTVVLVREDEPDEKRLVAYVVPQHEAAPSPSDLRAYLKGKLPDYMVPSAFVFIDSIPLSPHGKVDRQALPEPDRNSTDLAEDYVGPRNAVEDIIAAAWSEILRVKPIGVYDNFFDLGGHSLKATQVISRLRKAFQSEIPLRLIFESPTIAELAAVIDSKTTEELTSNKLNRVLKEVEAMPEEQAQRLLVDQRLANR